MCQMEILLLGTPRVMHGEERIGISPKNLTLLSYLVLVHETERPRAVLVDLFWPASENVEDDDDRGKRRTSLRVALKDLRKVFGSVVVPKGDPLASLHLAGTDQVDVLRFRRLVSDSKAHGCPSLRECPECIDRLSRAVGLYRGEFLSGINVDTSRKFEAWREGQRADLASDADWALEELAQGHERDGDLGRAMQQRRRRMELQPDNGDACMALMVAYHMTRRHDAARRVYQEHVKELEELGVDPTFAPDAAYDEARSRG